MPCIFSCNISIIYYSILLFIITDQKVKFETIIRDQKSEGGREKKDKKRERERT